MSPVLVQMWQEGESSEAHSKTRWDAPDGVYAGACLCAGVRICVNAACADGLSVRATVRACVRAREYARGSVPLIRASIAAANDVLFVFAVCC